MMVRLAISVFGDDVEVSLSKHIRLNLEYQQQDIPRNAGLSGKSNIWTIPYHSTITYDCILEFLDRVLLKFVQILSGLCWVSTFANY